MAERTLKQPFFYDTVFKGVEPINKRSVTMLIQNKGNVGLQEIAVITDADHQFVGLRISADPLFWERYIVSLESLLREVEWH